VEASATCTQFQIIDSLVRGLPERAVPAMIAGLVVDSRHRTYILDPFHGAILAVDSAGRERWKRGGLGAGPTELLDPLWLRLQGDVLGAWDRGNARLSLWTTEGEPVGVLALHEAGLLFAPLWAGLAGPRHVAAALIEPVRGGAPRGPRRGVFILAEFGSRATDTLAHFEFPPFVLIGPPGRQQSVGAPLGGFPVFAADHRRVLFSHGTEYVVRGWRVADGSTFVVTGAPGRPSPVPDHDRYVRRRLNGAEEAGGLVPDSLPVVRALGIGARGDVLVGTYWWRDGLQQWDRWTAEARLLESVLLPIQASFVTAVEDMWYGVVTDSLDLQSVVRFRQPRIAPCIAPDRAIRNAASMR
jgi:hypothetical protein